MENADTTGQELMVWKIHRYHTIRAVVWKIHRYHIIGTVVRKTYIHDIKGTVVWKTHKPHNSNSGMENTHTT